VLSCRNRLGRRDHTFAGADAERDVMQDRLDAVSFGKVVGGKHAISCIIRPDMSHSRRAFRGSCVDNDHDRLASCGDMSGLYLKK
jgi:hypothetical protein